MEKPPCDKCPEGQPATALPQLSSASDSYIFYNGGPFDSIYTLIAQAIPGNANLKHGRPTVYTSGALEYPPGDSVVEDIPGYQRDAANPRRFRPVWPPCIHRMLRIRLQGGLLEIHGMCCNATTGNAGRVVSLEQCQKCPLHR